jgi:uncharacterized protein (DUF2252 family)
MTPRRSIRLRVGAGLLTRDVVSRIQTYNADREPERRALKWRAMSASPFAFFRGTANVFWDDLATQQSALPASPLVWACGDLHLENFGSYRGDNGLAYFDLNDFDEAARAPLLWELARFVASVFVAAPALTITRQDATEVATTFLATYRVALLDGKARWIERATAQGMVRDLLRSVKGRTRAALLDKRTVLVAGERRLRIDNQRALPVTAAQRALVTQWCNRFAQSELDPKFFRVLDVARRVAGTGSLGVERFVILVRGEGPSDGNVLLDAKQARPSTLAAALRMSQPTWRSEAERVVTIQHRVQAISPALLRAPRFDKSSVILRELQPVEDRLMLATVPGRQRHLLSVARTMGHLVAWAHLRASGRDGTATADALHAFARTKGWRDAVLEYGRWYYRQVEADARRFAVAYEDGMLS